MASHSLQKMKSSHPMLHKALDMASKFKTRLDTARGKVETVTETAVHTLEVAGTSFGLGFLAGSSDSGKVPELMGVPTDLALGVAAHAGAFFGVAGKASHHLHGVGDGALAHYAAIMGQGAGAAWKAKGNKAAAAGEGLSDDEARRAGQSGV